MLQNFGEIMIKDILLIGLGGAVGSILRYLATIALNALHYASWTATLGVNCIGSFLIGLFMAVCTDGDWKLMLTVGLCGGFTTYSTFSAQSLEMLHSGDYLTAGIYILSTIVLCLLFVWTGMYVGAKLGSHI